MAQQATFPRAARLLRPSQYRAVFAHGEKFVCDGFVIIAAANGEDRARLGLALAKRRIRRAVDRSRVKRVVRESFRYVRADLPATDIVVLARNRTATMDNAMLTAQLARVWRRLARSV
ncbi:ribonuclease P protein component [Salinisphaera sp.]|uniref:ribonuclease P protein component n=1 Tax=Salinisphaera sp. TaxID=1914330 RepID=UPI002D79E3E7|nr:ribonuclease P protein component [Salinisphaera sp.]HET7313321.1 ribonuclease P protein component [Salinisphaera sp.]